MGAGLSQELRAVQEVLAGTRQGGGEEESVPLGVSRGPTDAYVCRVRRALRTSAGECRLWFEAVGDMSLGELQDPASSVLGVADPGAAEPSLALSPLVSVDLAVDDRQRRVAGSLTFADVPAGVPVFFRYGSGGFAPAGPLTVEAAARPPPTEEDAGAAPLCVSRYNDKYLCTVTRGNVLPSGEARLSFNVVGDMSLGQLQQPQCSKLVWKKPLGEHTAQEVSVTPADVRLEENDQKRRISGALVFRGVPVGQDVDFEYGSGGYSRARLRLEAVPSVVLTTSAAAGPGGALAVCCTSLAGAEVARVDAADLGPEQSVAQLRRALAGRLGAEEGQLSLVTPGGALLGEEHGARPLSEVFGAEAP